MAEYISKDKFIHFLFKEIAHVEETQTDTEIPISLVLQSVVNEVKKFKSEDVQPVKHGRWIDGDYRCVTAVCSKCKHLRLGNGAKFATRIALYCEHCGARMDGET